MRRIFQTMLWVLSLGIIGPSWANDPAPPNSTVTGNVYRCKLPDGSLFYKSKPVAGAECAAIKYSFKESGRPSPAAAPGWHYVTSSAVADSYVQLSSIKRNGGKVGAWVMESYKEPQTNNFTKAPFQSAMRRLSVKCDDRQINQQKTTFTAEPFGRGNYVGEWRPLGAYGDFATPGSIDDAIAAFVCESK